MKKRAFVRYSKQGKIVPGSLILTSGSFPSGPSTWKEVPADLCCPPVITLFNSWKVVTGGEAGDGIIFDDNRVDNYTIIGPNDSEGDGWVYMKKYFAEATTLNINYNWATLDEGISVDRPVYWKSNIEPTGIPDDTTSKVATSPANGNWLIPVNAGEWFAIGIYSTDSCCGRGFLQVNF